MAAARPVQGREAVLKLLQGLVRTGFKPGDRFEVVSLNGRESLVVRNQTGVVTTAVLLGIGAGAIQKIYFMRNPDKLVGL